MRPTGGRYLLYSRGLGRCLIWNHTENAQRVYKSSLRSQMHSFPSPKCTSQQFVSVGPRRLELKDARRSPASSQLHMPGNFERWVRTQISPDQILLAYPHAPLCIMMFELKR